MGLLGLRLNHWVSFTGKSWQKVFLHFDETMQQSSIKTQADIQRENKYIIKIFTNQSSIMNQADNIGISEERYSVKMNRKWNQHQNCMSVFE